MMNSEIFYYIRWNFYVLETLIRSNDKKLLISCTLHVYKCSQNIDFAKIRYNI